MERKKMREPEECTIVEGKTRKYQRWDNEHF